MSIGDVRAMYHAAYNLGLDSHGIVGYHVEKKYLDAAKMKEEKLFASKDRYKSNKPVSITKKKSFIDDVQKLSARYPGPSTYEPSTSRTKTDSRILPGTRKTIFEELSDITKKHNFPAPAKYSKVESSVDKSKLKGDMSKSINANYLESSMRKAMDAPGVGNYNSYHKVFEQKKGNKWVKERNKSSKSESKTKFPPVGTYNPEPTSFTLFSSNNNLSKSKSRSTLERQERFKTAKNRDVPFYNVLSEWGLGGKNSKKDILTKVSRTTSLQNSIYH